MSASNNIPLWFLKKPLSSRHSGEEASDDATALDGFNPRVDGVRRENLVLAAHFLWLNWVGGVGVLFIYFLSKHTFGVFCLRCGSKEDQVKKQKLDEEKDKQKSSSDTAVHLEPHENMQRLEYVSFQTTVAP